MVCDPQCAGLMLIQCMWNPGGGSLVPLMFMGQSSYGVPSQLAAIQEVWRMLPLSSHWESLRSWWSVGCLQFQAVCVLNKSVRACMCMTAVDVASSEHTKIYVQIDSVCS